LRLVIAGGGTGGHLFPGVAVAEAVLAEGGEVVFVGTAKGIEARVVPGLGWPLELMTVEGIKGRGLRGLFAGLSRLPRAWLQARAILRRIRPDAVLGVGGYASGPIVAVAALRGIPTAILEQNSVPGVTNKVLGRLVRRVFTTFPDVHGAFPARKVVPTGNPVRRDLLRRFATFASGEGGAADGLGAPGLGAPGPGAVGPGGVGLGAHGDGGELAVGAGSEVTASSATTLDTAEAVAEVAGGIVEVAGGAARPPRLFVFGGSQGARALNRAVLAALPGLLAAVPGVEILHQTGKADLAEIEAGYREIGLTPPRARVTAFLDDMATPYGWCDLVVCRAGATSLSELAVVGRPAILVPFPQAADNHQEHNARALAEVGAATVLPERDLTAEALAGAIAALLRDDAARSRMAAAMKAAARPEAARHVLDELHGLLGH
jgi:UDP-N-acetylglucosamine--N-acetylmuramyl-(pentapeptide) pyrophosphoryl-undecaprenol N-acetylglucosamine transferase